MTTPTPNTGWQRQENSTLTNPILRNVHAPTSNVVYTVGILGSVRKSTGAGGAGTFGDLDNPETFRLGGGDFVNPSTGWIIGQGHRIMRTDDGGVTFVDQMPFGSGFGQDIDFFDLNNGLAGGDQGFLVFTNDGGTTWSQASVSSATTNAVAMASAMDMFAVGNSGRVSYSADGGANWTQTILPGSPQLLGVDFLDPGNGLAVGAGGVCFRYAAGVWAPVPSPAALDILDVVMDGPNHGWACGLAGQVYEYDGSQLLLAHFGPQSDPLHGIAVTSTGEVWAIGSFANAAHFDGVTWTSPKVGTSEDVHAVCFVGPGEGFFIGRQNMVFAFTAQ